MALFVSSKRLAAVILAVSLCVAPAGLCGANRSDPSTWDAVPSSWHDDLRLYPKAYGVLGNGRLMHPVDMSDWPVRIGADRQLFVDDYLIARKRYVTRQIHQVTRHPKNPLLVPDRPWEKKFAWFPIVRRDAKTGRFRMWYGGGLWNKLPSGMRVRYPACYAESADGITWTKPELGLYEYQGSKKNNLVNPAGCLFALFEEPDDPDPKRRYKGLFWHEPPYVRREGYFLYMSPDGIRWTCVRKAPVLPMGSSRRFPPVGVGDAVFVYRDRRLGKYVANVKLVIPTVPRRKLLDVDSLKRRVYASPKATI